MSEHRLRAVIYARYSSDNQREVSIDEQVEAGKKFIAENNMEYVRYYADKAKTGRNQKRKGFKELMGDAERDVYDVVVLWHTDRINRNMLNAFATLSRLFEHKKDFLSVCQTELNQQGSLRMLLFAIYAWKDELVSIDIGRNVSRSLHANAERCHPNGVKRYGWDIAGAHIDSEGKFHAGDHYVLNEREAEGARLAFRLRGKAVPYDEVSAALWAAGHRAKDGGPITADMVRAMVRRKEYKGVYVWSSHEIEGGIPRIVSDREWEAAQHPRRKRKEKKRKPRPRHYKGHRTVREGDTFGNLVAVELARVSPNHHHVWLCRCQICGATKTEWATRLTSGRAVDCGCASGDGRERDELGRFA